MSVETAPKPALEAAVGRWKCHLCPFPTWTSGTYQDWKDHYETHREDA